MSIRRHRFFFFILYLKCSNLTRCLCCACGRLNNFISSVPMLSRCPTSSGAGISYFKALCGSRRRGGSCKVMADIKVFYNRHSGSQCCTPLEKSLPEHAPLLFLPSHRRSSLPLLKLVEFQDLSSRLGDASIVCLPATLPVFLRRCQVLRFAQSDRQVCAWFTARCTYRRREQALKKTEQNRWRQGSGRDALLLPVHLLWLDYT